jgi:hypothetical protein
VLGILEGRCLYKCFDSPIGILYNPATDLSKVLDLSKEGSPLKIDYTRWKKKTIVLLYSLVLKKIPMCEDDMDHTKK